MQPPAESTSAGASPSVLLASKRPLDVEVERALADRLGDPRAAIVDALRPDEVEPVVEHRFVVPVREDQRDHGYGPEATGSRAARRSNTLSAWPTTWSMFRYW